jgi:tRNA-specific adenosine deaminase 1
MDWTPTLLRHFDSLGYAPPQRTFTVLAAFFLVNELDNDFKIVSMSTGTKCLPTKNYSKSGDVVHDFHAEVLARRGAVRWLLTEMARGSGRWLTREHTYWTLRQGVTMNMYISELPCM